MAIEIKRVGELFVAQVTPPHGKGKRWETIAPMQLDELVRELLSLGCHQQDIGDALYAIDPKLIGL